MLSGVLELHSVHIFTHIQRHILTVNLSLVAVSMTIQHKELFKHIPTVFWYTKLKLNANQFTILLANFERLNLVLLIK